MILLTAAPSLFPSNFSILIFNSKLAVAHMRNDITCSRAHDLEYLEFSTIWLRLQFHSLTKYICAVYFSPNSFDYLTSKLEYILSHFPHAEISILGYFNVHYHLLSLTNRMNKPSTLLSFMT